MKQLVESNDDVSANVAAFRQLQQDWKNTGPVPPTATNELWKQYNLNRIVTGKQIGRAHV